ncbi:hypothetical protein [Blastomonas sp.]|uniref:hypothetical protein n=1 Tax=Blastomonas sp. TaxID=1909299 RepID=UPI0035938893
MTPEQEILEDALVALRQRQQRFREELADHAQVFPLSLDNLPPDTLAMRTHLAAFAKRYEMTQDQIVRRLFRSVAAVTGIVVRAKGIGELIETMHALGIVEDVDKWHQITRVRNELAHDYALTVPELARCINEAWDFSPDLIAMIDKVDRYVAERTLLADKDHD